MDSGIGDDEYSNADVLDLADKYDADFVVAKDYLHDRERTTDSIREFVALWESHPCRATPMIPLQPSHAEHYNDLGGHYHYLLGGMAFGYSTREIIAEVGKFRERAGMGPYVHLLGVGANAKLLNYLARNPEYVQSIDCSTPEQCAINSSIYGVELKQKDYAIRTGDDSSKTRHGLAKHLALTLNDSIRMRYEKQEQSTLGRFA